MTGDQGNLSLGEQLRKETRTLHMEVERSAFIATLLSGRLSLKAYNALLRNFYDIYEALEAAIDACKAASLAEVFVPALRRVPKIEIDLDALHGSGWRTELVTQPATRTYVDRLRNLKNRSADEPDSLVIAHVYVRYLGDLSGGQILQSIVASSLALSNDRGTAFYDFGDRENAEQLARDMRAGFRTLNLNPPTARAIVDEAIWAFELHRELFAELAAEYLDPKTNSTR